MTQPEPLRPKSTETDREKARLRAAIVRQRLRLATDALAAAHLLLGLNSSQSSVGRQERK